MSTDSLFGETVEHPSEKPVVNGPVRHRILITVKAGPNPSTTYGETVCVAGIRLQDTGPRDWIRLYPINFRHLPDRSAQFAKYDVISVECLPANEARLESWRPIMSTLRVETHISGWPRRRPLVDPMIDISMCEIRDAAKADPRARSLALIRPTEIMDLRLERRPGWTREEQLKIDHYVSQLELDLFGGDHDKTPLEAPRFRGHYRWRCGDPGCRGHEQSIIDWEFVALQRHLHGGSDIEAEHEIKKRFLDEVCASQNDVAF